MSHAVATRKVGFEEIKKAAQGKKADLFSAEKDSPVFGAEVALLESILLDRIPDLRLDNMAILPSPNKSTENLGKIYQKAGVSDPTNAARVTSLTLKNIVNDLLGQAPKKTVPKAGAITLIESAHILSVPRDADGAGNNLAIAEAQGALLRAILLTRIEGLELGHGPDAVLPSPESVTGYLAQLYARPADIRVADDGAISGHTGTHAITGTARADGSVSVRMEGANSAAQKARANKAALTGAVDTVFGPAPGIS